MPKTWVVIVLTCCLAISEQHVRESKFHYCNVCGHVNTYNICIRDEDTCTAPPGAFCYTRMVSKDSVLQFVDRGCVKKCIHQQIDEHYRNFTYCCADKHFCNGYNIWPE